MHSFQYFITSAENEEEAKSNVESWIDDHAESEFFDYGMIDEESEKQVVLLDEIREQLRKERIRIFTRVLPTIKNKIYKCEKNKLLYEEGYHHKRYGRILCENLSEYGKYFNIDSQDWKLPTDDHENCEWYAVFVDLHY
jgi:single-stranded DNA-specific DHH superfamily exonuclease